jgi:cytochrome P450
VKDVFPQVEDFTSGDLEAVFAPRDERAGELSGEQPYPVDIGGGRTAWRVAGNQVVRELLADPRTSVDDRDPRFPTKAPSQTAAWVTVQAFKSMDDPDHSRLRSVFEPHFDARATAMRRPRFEALAEELCDSLAQLGPPAEIVGSFAKPFTYRALGCVLGAPDSQWRRLQAIAEFSSSPALSATELTALLEHSLGFINELVDAGRGDPEADVIASALAGPVAAGTISERELVLTVRMLIAATGALMVNTLALATVLLSAHGDQRRRWLAGGPSFRRRGMLEVVRYLPIQTAGVSRLAIAGIDLGAVTIAAGDGILAALGVANRDPAAFTRPDALDLEREDLAAEVGFGYGPHDCMGRELALTLLEVAFATLYARFPALRPAAPLDEIGFTRNAFLFGLPELPVLW